MPLWMPRCRWEDSIRKYLGGTGIAMKNWIDSARHRDCWRSLVNLTLNLRVPQAMMLVSLKTVKSCYYSVQTLWSSRLLSKNLKIKIYKTLILPVVLYGCETWSLRLREEHRIRVFENRILRWVCSVLII